LTLGYNVRADRLITEPQLVAGFRFSSDYPLTKACRMQDVIQTDEYKTCSKCEASKSVCEFSKEKKKKCGLQPKCKECVNNYLKRYRAERRESIRKKGNKRYQDNREKMQEYNNKYRKKRNQENPERMRLKSRKYYQENRETILDKRKRKAQTESGKFNNQKSVNKRRALKAGATVEDFTPKEVFIRDRYICQACGIKTRPDYKNKYHAKYPNLDHIIPLSVGGEHSRRNTQCLCRGCNTLKGNRHANDQMLLIG